MKRPVRILLKVLFAVVMVVVAVAAFAMTDVRVPATSGFVVPMQEVRALATSTGEPLPTELRSLKVGFGGVPRIFVVGGSGFEDQRMTFYSYQLVYEGGRTVIIDAVHDEPLHQEYFRGTFLRDGYAKMQQAMSKADAIAITHEHFDHCAGIAKSPDFERLAPRVVLNEEQVRNPLIKVGGFDEGRLGKLQPLRYERLHLLRPGVVLIKAPGHTPGTQLIYVRLASGREFLLVGDIAWNMDNIRLPRAHPRVVNWLNSEDGKAMAAQLRALHDLAKVEPDLNLVVAHDEAQMDDYLRRGFIQDGFR
ncbi:MAG TPA: MBL fold metallo-hydrolase [Myxococcaceae bacterium]|nr:MBL fold metallo-hydrolase [Myxococcaceae bacterium]